MHKHHLQPIISNQIQFKSKNKMIGITEMYRQANRIFSHGIEGYQVEKKYEQPERVLKDRNAKDSKVSDVRKIEANRQTYLDEYTKAHDYIPGPGNYLKDDQKKIKKLKSKCSIKKTYLDQIVEQSKKQKFPAPGSYNLFKNQKQIKQEKKKLAARKITQTDRFTYLDGIQYQASITPGVGSYNTSNNRPRSASTAYRKISKPEQWIRIDKECKKKKKIREPDVGTYNPKYLEERKSFSRKSKGYCDWGHVERFKNTVANSLGPGSYNYESSNNLRKNSLKNIYYH